MIYLNNTPETVSLLIPRNGFAIVGDLTFRLRSTIDKDTVIDDEVTPSEIGQMYLTIPVTIPDGLPCGEYEYILMDDEKVISTGLLALLGESETNEYSNDVIYEQYEAE